MEPTDEDLLAYLDEMLPAPRAAAIECQLRDRSDLRRRTALLARRRDHGGHSLGEIWRRHRLSCPSRRELANFVLGVLDPAFTDYVSFHLHVVECPPCLASLEDLQGTFEETDAERTRRERRYFESSAGLLRSRSNPPE